MNKLHLSALAVFLAAAPTAGAQFTFDPGVDYVVGLQPGGVAAADLDGDSDRDLAVTVDAPDRLVFLLNDGAGNFAAGGSFFLANGAGAGAVVAGDLDNDGDMDLAVAYQNTGRVQVVLNSGAGVFAAGATITVGANPRGLDIGDHDGDADLDLVVANRDSNTATVMTNAGNATFTTATLSAGLEPRGSTFGDFDNDNDLDVAVSNHDDRTISVFSNTAGSFSLTTTLTLGPNLRSEGITAADLDGDGDDDLAAAANGNLQEVAVVFIAQAFGLSFSGPFAYATSGTDTSNIVAADFDCDGSIDLATGNEGSGNVSLLRNSGTGTFGAANLLAAGTTPEALAAADLDGDGDADLAAANRDSNDVTVFRNQTCAGGLVLTATGTCPGSMTFQVNGATAGGTVAWVAAFGTGSTTVPAGQPCAGTVLGLNGTAFLAATGTADASGNAAVTARAPGAACGRVFVQAVDLGTCGTSNVLAL